MVDPESRSSAGLPEATGFLSGNYGPEVNGARDPAEQLVVNFRRARDVAEAYSDPARRHTVTQEAADEAGRELNEYSRTIEALPVANMAVAELVYHDLATSVDPSDRTWVAGFMPHLIEMDKSKGLALLRKLIGESEPDEDVRSRAFECLITVGERHKVGNVISLTEAAPLLREYDRAIEGY